MKHLKQYLATALALIVAMAVATPALAAEIRMEGVKKGETYSAYKILNYTSLDTNNDSKKDAYSYFLTAEQYDAGEDGSAKAGGLGALLESTGLHFTRSADGDRYFVDNTSSFTTEAQAKVITQALYADYNSDTSILKAKCIASATAIAEESGDSATQTKATFQGLEDGYWFVTSSVGSLCSLQSYDDEDIVVEKNSAPSIDKRQKADPAAETSYENRLLHLGIGDTVYYQIEITDGTGTDAAMTITDALSAGITYQGDAKLFDEDGQEITGEGVTIETSGNGFTATLDAGYVAGLGDGAKAYLRYTGVINKDAVVDNATANSNTATLEYSHQTSVDTTYVETYDILVHKVISEKLTFLDGAEFKLYDAETGGNQILLSKDAEGTGMYVDAEGDAATTIDINSADGVNVRGLKPGTYWLEEVVVPNGYNKLAGRSSVEVTAGQTGQTIISIENSSGTVLPHTGGMGTTLFYLLGSSLVLTACAVLMIRGRMSAED